MKSVCITPQIILPTSSQTYLADFSLLGGAESLSEGKQPPNWLPRRTEIPHPQNLQSIYGSAPQDPSDFLWLMTEEPHRSRRKAILKAHPEVSNRPTRFPFVRLYLGLAKQEFELEFEFASFLGAVTHCYTSPDLCGRLTPGHDLVLRSTLLHSSSVICLLSFVSGHQAHGS